MGGIWREGRCDVMWSFDGRRPWGHLVKKQVNKVMLAYLLHYWQETMAQCSTLMDWELCKNANFDQFGVRKNSFIKACSMVDYDLELHPVIDSFYSGTAAVTIIREGDLMVLANIGDSRAVLGTASDDHDVVAVQLTLDFKPSLPYFGLISEPDVIQRTLTTRDRFVILATDGVWDVVSNEKAMEIVSLSADEREKSAKRLVEYAAGCIYGN